MSLFCDKCGWGITHLRPHVCVTPLSMANFLAMANEKENENAMIQQAKSALDTQVGGDHYKSKAIQPIQYIHANDLGFIEGSIVKYITRWREKGGVKDLEKIKHYVDLLIELEAGKAPEAGQP